MVNTLTASSALHDHNYSLKKAFVLILLRNLQPCSVHVNGARYAVEIFSNSLLHLRKGTGLQASKLLALPKTPCGPGTYNVPKREFIRMQILMCVCSAIIINKAQGESFSETCGVDVRYE